MGFQKVKFLPKLVVWLTDDYCGQVLKIWIQVGNPWQSCIFSWINVLVSMDRWLQNEVFIPIKPSTKLCHITSKKTIPFISTILRTKNPKRSLLLYKNIFTIIIVAYRPNYRAWPYETRPMICYLDAIHITCVLTLTDQVSSVNAALVYFCDTQFQSLL